MPQRLIAIHGPPSVMIDALRSAWDDGAVVLALPEHRLLADAAIARFAPDAVVDVDGTHDGPGGHPTLPGNAALVLATSGSTGQPKGVVLTHDALEASTTRSVVALGAHHGDRFGLVLPLHHIAGIQVVLRSWHCGTEPLVLDKVTDLFEANNNPVHVSVVGSQLEQLVSHPAAESHGNHLATVLVGGGPVAATTLSRAREFGWHVVTSYGMTETAGGCVYDGTPLPDVDVAVVDDLIRIRGPVLFHSYLGHDAPAITPDGWFVTGDRGTIDADGRVQMLGRADDIIVTGGENVAANVVANALRQSPAVADAAVIGCDDDRWGAIVCAVVVSTPHGSPTLSMLQAHVRRTLPEAYVPRRLATVTRIPTTALGKPDATALRALFDRRTDGEGTTG